MSREEAAKLFAEGVETGEAAELLVFIADHLKADVDAPSEGLAYICASLFKKAEELHAENADPRTLDASRTLPDATQCVEKMDAREVMSHLLLVDIAHAVTVAALPFLVEIWRRTYLQLSLDVVRRRRRAGSARPSATALALSMQAWTSELISKMTTEVLPRLITDDAYLSDTAVVVGTSREAVPDVTANPNEELFVARALVAAFDLCDALLTEGGAPVHGTVLALLGVCFSRPRCPAAEEDGGVRRLRESLLARCVARLKLRGIGPILAMYDEQLEESDVHLSDFLYEDNERGKDQRGEKVLALLQAREAELEELTLFKCSSETSEAPAPDFAACTSIGSLCVVGNSLLTGDEALFLFSEPSSVFMSCVSLLAHCLKSTSVSGIALSLSFLQSVSSSVPKYSLLFAGEEAASFLWSNANSAVAAPSPSLSFKTKKYATLFNLLKQLIIISSTCQSRECREQSKAAILGILVLFNRESRVRLQSSLISLCPYPSVVTFLLNDLFHAWREYNAEGGPQWAPLNIMEHEFPPSLLGAMMSFHKNILHGQAEFVDPLVAAINFLYVFLALDVKQQGRQRLSYHQQKIQWVPPPAHDGVGPSAWYRVLERVTQDLVPQLERLLQDAENSSIELLRPIDGFALASSLDMLKTFF